MTVGKTHVFRDKFPSRHIQVGIAEQNMMGIAAGLAQMGRLPVAILLLFWYWKNFRSNQGINIYSELNVKIIGYHAGLTLGPDRATHQTMENIALMASLPNMSIVAPADAQQTIDVLPQILDSDSPTYLRLLFPNIPKTIEPNSSTLGKNQVLKKGSDITFISYGQMVDKCIKASRYIESEFNVSVEIINVHTIKPLDFESIATSLEKTKQGLVVRSIIFMAALDLLYHTIVLKTYLLI